MLVIMFQDINAINARFGVLNMNETQATNGKLHQKKSEKSIKLLKKI